MAATQLDEANELLRAALEIIHASGRAHSVTSAYRCTTKANGGGDGLCVAGEIEDYLDTWDVPREPQFPDETTDAQ